MPANKSGLQKYGPDMLRGLIIYSAGDTAARLMLGTFTLAGLFSIALIGGVIYSFEIPAYFRWIDRKAAMPATAGRSLYRTLLALLYFNPLWIARHLAMIHLFSGNAGMIGWHYIATGTRSFLYNIPVSFAANFLIQNKVPLRYRFFCSAIFSALMAVYYALSEVWFR